MDQSVERFRIDDFDMLSIHHDHSIFLWPAKTTAYGL